MITFPNAKINLGLNIIAKRSDGYHNLETVFYPIPLHDALEITPRRTADDIPAPEVIPSGTDTHVTVTDDYTLRTAGNAIEGPAEKNLVVKAFRKLQASYGLPPVNINLNKHIPSGAGLGGGSADAAFTLKTLNELFALGLSAEELEHIAAELGADCAFFVRNTPVFATGIGNIFTPMTCLLKGLYIIVVKPEVFVSTREAYAGVTVRRPERCLTALLRQPMSTWRGTVGNDFEESLFPAHPEIEAIKEKLYREGAIYASMSGSGSSVFGLFTTPPACDATDFAPHFFHRGELD